MIATAKTIILFTKPDCKKCEFVKSHLPNDNSLQQWNFRIVDLTTAEGKAEAAYFEVVDKPLPILIVDDELVATGSAIKIITKLKHLANQASLGR